MKTRKGLGRGESLPPGLSRGRGIGHPLLHGQGQSSATRKRPSSACGRARQTSPTLAASSRPRTSTSWSRRKARSLQASMPCGPARPRPRPASSSPPTAPISKPRIWRNQSGQARKPDPPVFHAGTNQPYPSGSLWQAGAAEREVPGLPWRLSTRRLQGSGMGPLPGWSTTPRPHDSSMDKSDLCKPKPGMLNTKGFV